MKPTETATNHNSAFDILRIISAFSVVMLHVSSPYLMSNSVTSATFKAANFINSISRFGVPIFVMISGALFLSETKSVSIKKLWCKNILRLFIIYMFWALASYAFQCFYFWNTAFWKQGILQIISGSIYSSEHFWFIFMIIGLYALVPFLRTWLHNASKSSLCYFTVLFFVFQVLRITVSILIDKSLIYKISGMVQITELTGYISYFVFGYLLTRFKLPKKYKIIIYSLVPIGIIVNYIISNRMSVKLGYYTAGIYDSFGFFTFIHVIALFLFVTDLADKLSSNKFLAAILQNIALDTLGIYMMHMLVLNYLLDKGILIGLFPTIIEIILLGLLCFGISCFLSALLRRIPYIGRYLC